MINRPTGTNVTIYPTDPVNSVYKVLDAEGSEITRIIWDGESPYDVEAAFGPGAHLEYVGPA